MADWTGVLLLDLEDRKGKTVAKKVYFQGAYKVMRPVYHDQSGQVCYYLLNPGGGYLDGDRYRMQITAEEGAKVTLTTQSATKVYKTPNDYAYQETEIHLKKGSYLEYIPDPLIVYKDAHYKQKNVIHMEQGAAFIYSDIITPGWSPDGQPFSYDVIQLVTEIKLDGKLGVFDHIKLTPARQNLSDLGGLEGHTHLGSMLIVGDQTNDELLDEIYQTIQLENSGHCLFGLSRLEIPGFSVRVLAHSTQLIERIFAICHRIVNQRWFSHTPSSLRKY